MTLTPNQQCPCGSGLKYKRCCRQWHAGEPAPTAEALMRSRYAAFAGGLVDYIVATTHPDSPHRERDTARWRSELVKYMRDTTFHGLMVRTATLQGNRATVEFEANLRQGGQDVVMLERSMFFEVDERWLYHSGTRPLED